MRWLAPVVAAAILFAAALPAPADLSGVPVRNGNKVLGEFNPSGDVDTFAIQLIAGGKLTVKVVTVSAEFLSPLIEVRDPDGLLVPLGTALKGAGGPKPQVKNLLIGKSGTWSVSVRSEVSAPGAYQVSFASKSPPKVIHLARTVPGAASEAFEAYGFGGTVLGFSVKLKSGDPVGDVEVVDPIGAPVPIPTVPAIPITRKGLFVKGKNFLLGSGFGSYGVIVDGSGGFDSVVDATILTRHPKPDRTIITLGAEPRPTSMGPATGVGGTMVIINGTGFVTGADVFFGTEQAGPAVVDSPTQMHCPAPPGAAADAGSAVDVFVANPDGQSGKVPFKFQYIGPPKITAVTPAFSPLEGGVTHTVSGSGFRDGFTLLLGGEAPDSIQLVTGNTITFVGKPRAAGSYTLTVTDDLNRTGSLGAAVTYVAPPTVTDVSPDSASFTGGRLITLSGTALFTGTRVFVDGVEATVLSATGPQASFTLPGGPAGTFDIVVRDQFARDVTVVDAISRRGPFVDRSATAVPPIPAVGTDFFGSALAVGDLDGDDKLDIVVTSPYPRYDGNTGGYFTATWALRNQGGFAFEDGTAARLPALSPTYDYSQAYFVAIGDLDGSPGADVVLSTGYPLTSPNRFFTVNTTQYAYYIYNANLGYNVPDYPTANATRMLSNDGSGVFTENLPGIAASGSTPFYAVGERWQAYGGALGDLNGDGDTDLFIAESYYVVTGTQSGSYTYNGTTYLGQTFQFAPASRPMLNDGAGALGGGGSMPGPYYMNGAYSYLVAEDFSGNSVALGDLDGDDDVDAVVSHRYPRYVYYLNTSTNYSYVFFMDATRVMRNDGAANFDWNPNRMPLPLGLTQPGSFEYWQADAVALGDLDVDGDLDMVLGKAYAFYWYDYSTSTYKFGPAIRVLENNGAGTFTEATGDFLEDTSFVAGSSRTILGVRSLVIGDLDGDEVGDLIVAGTIYYVNDNGYGSGYYGIVPSGPKLGTKILINDGAGHLADRTANWFPAPVNGDQFTGHAAALGDLDSDGDLDLVLALDGYPYLYNVTVGYNRPLRVFETK